MNDDFHWFSLVIAQIGLGQCGIYKATHTRIQAFRGYTPGRARRGDGDCLFPPMRPGFEALNAISYQDKQLL